MRAVSMGKRSSPVQTQTHGDRSETESQLFDCALTVFSEKGYDATSVRDIIRAAGVTQPTLYYYCESKLDLFQRLVKSIYEKSLAEIQRTVSEIVECRGQLLAIMTVSFAACAADPRIPRLMFQTAFGPPIVGLTALMDELATQRFAFIRNVIRTGVAAGKFPPFNDDGLALAFCCLMDQHINILARQSNPEQFLTPQLADWLVSLFLNGASCQR